MPAIAFNATIASHQNTLAPVCLDVADSASTATGWDCEKCRDMEEHTSAQDRNADELKKENERLCKTSKDLETMIASLRDSARTEQRAADEVVDAVRAECDSLQSRLARLEPVSTL